MSKKRLNLGCGTDIRKGWVNLDSAPLAGVDTVWDIQKLPLPFKDGAFDEILCQDILEHVEYVEILKDIHRIMEKGAKIIIRVPHFTANTNYIDPTHKKMFSVSTFKFFIDEMNSKRKYYFDFTFSRIESRRITFERSSRLFFYNKLVEKIINRSFRMQEIYETTFLSRLFPALNIEIELIK